MRFLVAEKLGPHKFKTPEGYLICTDAILSRTGKQEYKRCELFGDACEDPDKIVNVDRTDAEVFDDKAMASFENKPVCIEHPDHDVNAENHNELAVGFVRDIHKGEDNGHPVMMGTLVITDKDAVEAVESGEYKELSCGYDCDINDDDNLQQRNIRGNHVALCKQGRAGIARIVDTADDLYGLVKEPATRYFLAKYFDEKWETDDNVAVVKAKNETEAKSKLRQSGIKYDSIKELTHAEYIKFAKITKVIDFVKDVDPRQGEQKDDFIARFMSETKEEYPDRKQRFAVANSYWNKRTDDAEEDDIKYGYKDRMAGVYDKWYRYNRKDGGRNYDLGQKLAAKEKGAPENVQFIEVMHDMAVMRFDFSTNIAAFERAIINNDVAEFNSMLITFEKDIADYEAWKKEGRLSSADIGKVKRQIDKINSLLAKSKINKTFEVKDMATLIDADFSKQTKQGYQVLEMYRDGGRLHIIFKRANDFGVGLGYDTTDGQWSQGRYDFSTLEKARQALMEEKPYARRIQDSVNDANQRGIEIRLFSDGYQLAYVDKNGRQIYQRQHVSENEVKREIASAKRKGENVYYFVNADIRHKLGDEDWSSVEDENYNKANKPIGAKDTAVCDAKTRYTVTGTTNGVYQEWVIAASSSSEAVEKAKRSIANFKLTYVSSTPTKLSSEELQYYRRRPYGHLVDTLEDTGKWYRVAYYTIVGNSTNNYELFVRAEGYSDAKAKAAKAAKRIHRSEKICSTFDMHVSEVSEQEAKRQNPSIVFDSEVNFSDSAQTQDSKERLFTIEYKQDDVMYIRKVRASSIEDAISKVKDDAHKVVVFTNQVLSEMGKNNSIGKYDRVVQAMRSLYSESLLPDDKLKELIRKKVPEYIKKYVKDADVFLPTKYSKTFFSEQRAKEFAANLHKKYQIRAGKDGFGQNVWSVYWD